MEAEVGIGHSVALDTDSILGLVCSSEDSEWVPPAYNCQWCHGINTLPFVS